MTRGVSVKREWVVVTHDGGYVIDWGDDVFQDIRSGEFVEVKEKEISHHPTDQELDWLIHINRVQRYDSQTVYFYNLPERPQETIP
jgi:hypothetical protein